MNQQHIVITGGASGLGLGFACRYLQQGHLLSILDINISDESRQQLTAAAQSAKQWQYHQTDITDPESLQTVVSKAVAAFGAPSLAINSAGIAVNQSLANTTVADFQRVINVNLNGSFHFVKALEPHLHSGSHLAFVASMAGITSNYGYSAYGPSKFGVVGLATTLRYELEPRGIHISVICPPEVATPMVQQEHASGDPISLKLKQLAGSLPLDYACDYIVKDLQQKRWLIIPGHKAKATALAARLTPRLAHRLSIVIIKKLIKQQKTS